MSNRNFNDLPTHVMRRWGYSIPDKFSLKARASEAMRAATRRSMDTLRLGGDPDAMDAPVRSREVCNRWRYS